ncbi:uncharacterized protein LOC122808637 isoform X2 [Protopterus annectens]|nr:uncharacterized protein LOC122808637 isoform X2 [Protopterus annectens]
MGTISVGEGRFQSGVVCGQEMYTYNYTCNYSANDIDEISLEDILSDVECIAEYWVLQNDTVAASIESEVAKFSYPVKAVEKKRLTVLECVDLLYTCTDRALRDTRICVLGKKHPEPQNNITSDAVVVAVAVIAAVLITGIFIFAIILCKKRRRDEEMGTRSSDGHIEQMKSLLKQETEGSG